MLGPRDATTVSSDLLQLLLESSATGSADLNALLEAVGVDAAQLQLPHQRISAEQFGILWKEIEDASEDPCFGLHLGELKRGLPQGHVLSAVMMNSPTIRHALHRYCRYHDIMADMVQPRLSASSDGAETLTLESGLRLHRQHIECIFSLVVSTLRHLSRGKFEGQIRFRHPRPAAVADYERILGPSVHFDQPKDELIIAKALLDRPIPAADSELLEILEQYAQRLTERIGPENPWSAKVEEKLRDALCDGKPSLADIAHRLASSQRSLQNKLSAEGTTYQELLDRVRESMATFYLRESQMPIPDVAFLLGYSDQSAFNHAFKKWTGTSPSSYRTRPR